MRVFRLLVPALALALPAPLAGAVEVDGEPLYEHVTRKARSLAGKSYDQPDNGIPGVLKDLSYQEYRDIRFEKDQALWKEDSLFNVELFHLGFLYKQPVTLHQVVDGRVETVRYESDMFDYGDNENLEDALDPDLGYAGFRVHFPINRKAYFDEVIAFLGASYFRMVGGGQEYGLSARGLAVNTAVPEGEEFPRFTEFWLVRPGPEADSMTFYALLESQSVAGAYRFVLSPGTDTTLDVEARLFARRDIDKLGVAPLTSMFMYGDNRVRFHDDYRPEVHDSDGLLVRNGDDEWIWRPLSNGVALQVSTLMDNNPRGFGLVQRDRDFEHYLDQEARYHRRPSHWVSPRGGDWGKGGVQLIEIPSDEETNDNIVAFWMPDKPFQAGQERVFKYRLRTFDSQLEAQQLATVDRTRIGWGAVPGSDDKPPRSLRQFIVDFKGGALPELHGSRPVEAELSVNRGEPGNVTVTRLPKDHGWRVAFKLKPKGQDPADMRLYLSLRGRRLSETWSYVWYPKTIQ